MTQTIRRTAKISKPATKDYTPAALYRVYDKQSGVCLGYLAPSQDGKECYQVSCDDRGEWHCGCDGNAKWHRTCQHIKAVQEICAIRVAEGRPGCKSASLQAIDEAETARITVIAEQANAKQEALQAKLDAAKPRPNHERGVLNGGRPSVMDLIKAVRVA